MAVPRAWICPAARQSGADTDIIKPRLSQFLRKAGLSRDDMPKRRARQTGRISGIMFLSTAYTAKSEPAAIQKAADRIDRGIAGVDPPQNARPRKKAAAAPFQAVKGKYRKPGTGCVTQINDHLWEGRYSPKVNGKRMARNIYATTEAECEEKLAVLITEMKQELAALRARRPAV